MKKLYHFAAAMLVGLTAATAVSAAPSVTEILQNMENAEKLGADVTVRAKLTMETPDQGTILKEMILYRRDKDDAFLVVMTAPENEKGNGYLRVGDNMWMYRRNTRTFQVMGRNESIAGTDANADDIESPKYSKLYQPTLDAQGKEIITEETLGKAVIPVYRIEVNAKVKDAAFPKMIYWVRRDNFLVMKDESYSLSGTLMNSRYVPKYTKIEEKFFPLKELVVDEFEKGYQTLVDFADISVQPIDDAVFTKGYLENLSK